MVRRNGRAEEPIAVEPNQQVNLTSHSDANQTVLFSTHVEAMEIFMSPAGFKSFSSLLV